MKILPVGADLFRACWQKEGRTDRRITKLIFIFCNSANANKTRSFISHLQEFVCAMEVNTENIKYLSSHSKRRIFPTQERP
jgi:hypothetical protein